MSNRKKRKPGVRESLGKHGPGKAQLLAYAHEQLAIWDALRRMGFPADDIYAAFYNDGELFTTLKAGEKEFNVSISNAQKVETNEYVSLYTAECHRWNGSMTTAERDRILQSHMPVEKMVSIAMGLRMKDIAIPKMPNAPSAEDVTALQVFIEKNLFMNGEVVETGGMQGRPN